MSNLKNKCRIVERIKAHTNFWNWSKGSPCEATLYQKVENFIFWGRIPCADWGEILHSQVDPRARWSCQVWRESVQRVTPAGRKPDFWPVSKFNTGSLPLRSILPVTISLPHKGIIRTLSTWQVDQVVPVRSHTASIRYAGQVVYRSLCSWFVACLRDLYLGHCFFVLNTAELFHVIAHSGLTGHSWVLE